MQGFSIHPGHLARWLLPLLLLSQLLACSTGSFFSDSEKQYRSQREEADNLEIPPDLTSSSISDSMVIPSGTSTSLSEYSAKRQGRRKGTGSNLGGSQVLPQFDKIRVERDGDQRWLVIDAPPQKVWPKVVEFWRSNGLLLVEQNPQTGVMTTDWLESRADIKQGPITEFFRKTVGGLYSSATRDQFRVRLEPGERPGTTELYLTHRGMVEKLVENTSGEADTTYWTPRPNEPGTEAAMLRSLMVYLGSSEEQAKTALAKPETRPERAQLSQAPGDLALIIHEEFARAWRRTGVALDRVGFAVEDRDRSQGIYYVRYKALEGQQKGGFFSKLAFWRDDQGIDDKQQFRIHLREQDGQTRVTVEDKQGVRLQGKTASRLLKLIYEQVK